MHNPNVKDIYLDSILTKNLNNSRKIKMIKIIIREITKEGLELRDQICVDGSSMVILLWLPHSSRCGVVGASLWVGNGSHWKLAILMKFAHKIYHLSQLVLEVYYVLSMTLLALNQGMCRICLVPQ